MEIMRRPAHVRVLALLRRDGPMRFGDIESALDLNPKTVDRALKDLRRGVWVVPRTEEETPGGKILVRYEVSKRGLALLEVLDEMRVSARERKRALGMETVREMDALFT